VSVLDLVNDEARAFEAERAARIRQTQADRAATGPNRSQGGDGMISFSIDLKTKLAELDAMTDPGKDVIVDQLRADLPLARWHLIDQPDHEANVRAQGGRG
jgi:hypothetical protein